MRTCPVSARVSATEALPLARTAAKNVERVALSTSASGSTLASVAAIAASACANCISSRSSIAARAPVAAEKPTPVPVSTLSQLHDASASGVTDSVFAAGMPASAAAARTAPCPSVRAVSAALMSAVVLSAVPNSAARAASTRIQRSGSAI